MKYTTMIQSIAGAALVMGSVNAMASESRAGWYHDSNTGTYVNTSAPDYSSTPSMSGVKSKRGSGFANGVTQDSNTGTLMNTRVPTYEKQPGKSGQDQVTLNSFGGGAYQDSITGTLTRID